MGIHWAEPGQKSVGEYHCSGVPFLTASLIAATTTVEVSFPRVTKEITLRTPTDAKIRFAVTENGANGNPEDNFFLLDTTPTTFDIRTKTIFLRNTDSSPRTCYVFAGLTDITREKMITLTGSNGFEGVG